jgi:hypothetical protein
MWASSSSAAAGRRRARRGTADPGPQRKHLLAEQDLRDLGVRWPALIWSFEGLEDSAKEKVCRKNPAADWRTLLAYRAMGAYSRKEYREFILPGSPGPFRPPLPFLISVVPPSLINAASRARRKLAGA